MDMKSHTGYPLTLGIGSLILGSSTQSVKMRSFPELELVGVGNAIGFVE